MPARKAQMRHGPHKRRALGNTRLRCVPVLCPTRLRGWHVLAHVSREASGRPGRERPCVSGEEPYLRALISVIARIHCRAAAINITLRAADRGRASACAGATRVRLLTVYLQQVKGIEPSFSAWEADVLPLSDTRKIRELRLTQV